MKKKPMIRGRSALKTCIVSAVGVSLSFSQATWADTATADLEVKAGLAQSMTVDCSLSSLTFGITRFGTLTRAAATVLTLAPGTGAIIVTAGTGATGVSAGTGSSGTCSVSGSSAVEGTTMTVQIAGTTPAAATLLLDGSAVAIDGIGAPTAALNNLSLSLFTIDGAPSIDATGAGMINIGATLTIPAVLTEGNMGGYQQMVEVTISDGM